MGLGEAEFPGQAGVLERGLGRGARAAVVARDEDDVGVGLGDAGGDRADADLGDELHADAGLLVGVLEVVDQLGEVLDGVDVVVGRRRDEADAGGRAAGLGDPRVDLGARQLAALAGLRALGHLDLDLAGVDEVLAGDTEAAGGDLLDGGVLRIALLVGPGEAGGILAALTGVGLAADSVHRDGERLVCLLRDGAVRHRAGLEAAHDGFGGLDLLQRDRGGRVLELEQAPQRAMRAALVVDQPRVGLVGRQAVGPHRLLQGVDRLRREQVRLAGGAPLVQAAGGERAHVDRPLRVRGVMAQEDLLGDHVEPDPAHAGGRPSEVVVDDVLAEPERLEHLRAAVALDRGDAHLGHHLHHALGGSLDEVRAGLGVVDAGEVALANHVVDRLEGDVRVHRAAAVADQQGEVVHLAGLAGLEHQRHARAQALADQVVVEAGHREQRGDRREVLRHPAVAEDEDVDLFLLNHPAGHDGELLHRLGEALLAAGDAEEDRQHARL